MKPLFYFNQNICNTKKYYHTENLQASLTIIKEITSCNIYILGEEQSSEYEIFK